jgi:hypothetical protein
MRIVLALVLGSALLVACGDDGGVADTDSGMIPTDGGEPDAAEPDAGEGEPDAALADGGGADAAASDGGSDGGCSDRDGDGTCDAEDLCPDEMSLTEPTACGCDPTLRAGTLVASDETIDNVGTRKALVGDLDGDDDLDVFFVNAFHPDEVWFNDGSGSFTDSGAQIDDFVDSAGALADFDQDGDLDVMTGAQNRSDPDSRLYLNDGSGTFTASTVRIATGNFVSMAVGDFDADSYPDFAVSNFSSSHGTWAYTNDGEGELGFTGVDFGTLIAWGVAAGDVDGDSNDDVLIALSGAANQVRLSDGMGGFETGTDFGDADVDSFSVALGDFDGDGDLDAAVGNGGGVDSHIYMNDGDGVFTDSGQALTVTQPEFAGVADIDADGDVDVIFSDFANDPGGGARIFLNDGTGTFSLGQHIAVDFPSRGFGSGDLNGDGLVDIVIAHENGPNPIYLNSCTAAD